MAISFDRISADTRVPLAYFEVDSSQAGTTGQSKRTLLIGQRRASGTVAEGVPTRVRGGADAASAFGFGSQLHLMALAFRRQHRTGELWAIALDDAGGSTPASKELAVTGPATSNGTIHLYIGGQKLTVAVADGDTAAEIAAAIALASATQAPNAPAAITNPAAPSVNLTVTAYNAGTLGNAIDARTNYRGPEGGESYPAGVTLTSGGVDIAETPVRLATGATDPDLADAVAAMGDEPYEFIVCTATVLTDLQSEMDESTGRWSPERPLYGHVFSALDDTFVNVASAGDAGNNAHTTYAGVTSSPTTPWEIAAAVAGQVHKSAGIDPARPFHTLPLEGVLAPRSADRFTLGERNTLLGLGVTPLYVSPGGKVRMDPAITNYQEDAYGNPDASMRDLTTLLTVPEMHRDLKAHFESLYGRHKVANDGTNFGPGNAIVTPSMVAALVVSRYRYYERRGWVENAAAFLAHLIVERDEDNPRRINVLYPPDLVNPLEIIATRTAFRLQYDPA
jgi:phage tail sheath gpL-like